MAASEDLAIGSPIASISELAVVNVKLPASPRWSMFNVDEFAVLPISGEPRVVDRAPTCSFAPPGCCGRIIQAEDAVIPVIEENLRAIDDGFDIDPAETVLINFVAHKQELISSP